MKKCLSILLSVLFLLTALPLEIVSVAAETDDVNLIINGDFENGSEGWTLNSSASVVDGALQLTNPGAWSEAAMANIAVEVGTEYTLSWKSQRVSGSGAFLMFILNSDNSNHATTSGQNWMNSTSTDWVEHSLVFTANEANLKLKLSAEVNDPGVILIDDITLTATPEPVVGQITNGDFETGDATGWRTWQSTVISADAAYTGSYGANIIGNGGWGGFLDQSFNVEDGKTYQFSFWYKVNTSGTNWSLKGEQTGTNYGSGWVTAQAWTQVVVDFVVNGDTSIYLNFNGGGNGIAENVYVDDVKLVELVDPSDDGFIVNGDFETGSAAPWTLYSGSNVSANAAYTGNYGLHCTNPSGGWGGTAFQDFSVEVGKSYEVTMWAKAISQGQNIQVQNGGTVVAGTWFNKTEWTLLTFEFTATATNVRINICGGGTGANEEVYFDDIKVKELIDPSFDGYIYNGDFETGEVFPWDNLWGSCPTVEIVEGGLDSNYALHIVSNKWNHVRQTAIAVEADTWYKVTAWAKNTSDMVLLVKDGADVANLNQTGMNAGDEWTEFTGYFYTGEYTSVIVSLMGGENDEIAEKYGTFDNIVMEVTEEPGCEHEWNDATCTEPATCALCGATDGEALGHSYGEGVATQTPTCTTVGEKQFSCSVCGGIKTENVPALGHNFGEGGICIVCGAAGPTIQLSVVDELEEVNAGDEFQVAVNLLNIPDPGLIGAQIEILYDHDVFELVTYYDEDEEAWFPQIEVGSKYNASTNKYILFSPIDEETGYMERCLVLYLRTTAKETQTRYEEHFYTATFRVKDDAPSGTYDLVADKYQGGNIVTYGNVAVGDLFTAVNASVVVRGAESPCEHAWKDATCTEPATCALCGATDGEALGHSYGEGVATQTPTCTTVGEKQFSCSVCGGIKTENVPALGHNFGEGGICIVCGAAGPTIQLSVVDELEEVNAGDEFQVAVNLLNIPDPGLIGAQIEILYDHDVFELVTYYDEDEEAWFPQIEVGSKYNASTNKYILFSPIDEETGYMERCLVQYLRFTAKETQTRYEELFYTATFRVKDDAPAGNYELVADNYQGGNTVGYGFVSLGDLFTAENATITVIGSVKDVLDQEEVLHSVMDTENGNGLAFRFHVNVEGMGVVSGTTNTADYSNAMVRYNGEDYRLVGMGAVVTNKAIIGENESSMTLGNVNGATVLDIPAVYLCDLEPDSCAFAVRIVNIPSSVLAHSVYARPYWIIEADGVQIAIYGAIDSISCQEVLDSNI